MPKLHWKLLFHMWKRLRNEGKVNRCRLSHLRFCPPSPHSCSSLAGRLSTYAFRWECSRALQICASVYLSNGSMFIRRVPENNTGSWNAQGNVNRNYKHICVPLQWWEALRNSMRLQEDLTILTDIPNSIYTVCVQNAHKFYQFSILLSLFLVTVENFNQLKLN